MQPLQLFTVELDEPGREHGSALLHPGDHRPVFLGAEQLDFALALNNQPQRHRLHPACALGPGQLAPQYRRQGEAEQVIERAAGEIGVDQILIEFARVLHRLGDSRLGDGIERDPLDMLGQQLALGEQLADMP